MALLESCLFEEHLHIVAQLGASHDTVVAEQHSLAFQHILVGDEFHLGHQRAHGLVGRCERTWPGGSILGDATLVRHLLAGSIPHRHTCARVGDTAAAVHLHSVGLSHVETILEAHFLHVSALVGRCRETIVHPEE